MMPNLNMTFVLGHLTMKKMGKGITLSEEEFGVLLKELGNK